MDGQLRVFIVDDDTIMLNILQASLEGVGSVEVFSSAAACLQHLSGSHPDLFLLDVSMPEIDGFELCRRLKDDWETQDIPVIFISASDDGQTRLACYEAGGDDFIQKPFEAAELLSKIKVVGRSLTEKSALKEQAGYAQRTAMSAMVSMGELGVVLQFLSKSFACKNVEELANAILEAMQSYDLDTTVQLRLPGETLSLSRNGRDLPFEMSVLNHVSQSGRIFQFKSRCAFNYGHVTVLVNNMPLDDPDRAGRIRDNVALLAEGADARVKSIETDQIAQRRRAGIESALPRLETTLDNVQGNYRRNCFELTQIMIDFQESLTKSFVHLGLTESQEEEVSQLTNAFMGKMVGTQDASLQIVSDLEQLAGSLKALLKG